MAKSTIEITQSYQQIATGPVIITVLRRGKGSLLFNDTPSDVNALTDRASITQQFTEDENRLTFVRATGDGWKVIVDGVL